MMFKTVARMGAVLGMCGALAVSAQQIQEPKIAAIPFVLQWKNQPLAFQSAGNTLSVTAGEKTDMFRDPNATYNTNTAPLLLFTPDADFVLSARIAHDFAEKWDGGALVLWSDDAHWVKFCFEKDYTGAHRVVSVATNDISDDCNSVAYAGGAAYFKMAKAGNVITLYSSATGKDWLLVRHLQFNAAPVQVGFLAQSPTGKKCTVAFRDIRYENKKIGDPYKGE
jgi:regulation of enolase protein 1 (concanavalin A-like superfamily)